MIAFYYGLTGFACALYYRSQFMAGAGRGLEVGAGVLLLLANVLLIVATLAEWKQSVGLLVFGVPFVVGMLMTLVAARSQLKAWFLAGLCPILGGEILTYIFFKSCLDLKDPENSTAGDSWLGIGPPLVIGVGFLLLGVLLMVLWYLHNREFFKRRAEVFHEPEPEASPATGGS